MAIQPQSVNVAATTKSIHAVQKFIRLFNCTCSGLYVYCPVRGSGPTIERHDIYIFTTLRHHTE
jgi:hypothetical protein